MGKKDCAASLCLLQNGATLQGHPSLNFVDDAGDDDDGDDGDDDDGGGGVGDGDDGLTSSSC